MLLEDLKQADNSFKRRAIPRVLELNKQYRATYPERYGYNRAIADYIAEIDCLPTNPDIRRQLEHEVYLSQHDITNEKRDAYKTTMLTNGWLELTNTEIKDAYNNGYLLEVSAELEWDWQHINLIGKYKPFVTQDGGCYIMKPRAKRKGYPVMYLKNAFCKIIRKEGIK